MGRSDRGETMARQWQLLRLLPREPRAITSAELVDRLARNGIVISKRTVERDLQGLSSVFPLVANEGDRPFRWGWKRDAPALNLPGLAANEAIAFQLLQRFVGPLLPPSLLAVLSPYFEDASRLDAQREQVGWAQKVEAIPAWQQLLPPAVDPASQAALFEAVALERKVEADYAPRGEYEPRHYELHPLAIIQRGPVIYVLVRVGTFDDVLSFALHRFVRVRVLNEPANRIGFELDASIEAGFFAPLVGPMIKLVARFEREAAIHLAETPLSRDQAIRDDGPEHVVLEATVRANQQLVWFLRGFGGQVEVLSPITLTDERSTDG